MINISPIHKAFVFVIFRNRRTYKNKRNIADSSSFIFPYYTVLVPLRKEGAVVKDTINSLNSIEYPREKLQVLLLLHEDDDNTRSAMPERLPESFTAIYLPVEKPLTKGRSLNYGLCYAQGKYVTVFDAEDKPDADQLKKAAILLENSAQDIWALQARLCIYNNDKNWLTYLFFLEYKFWYSYYIPYLSKKNYPIPLGGTSNHFKKELLLSLGGWDSFNVTEDADLAVRIFKNGGKVAILDSETREKAPSKIPNWVRQRTRWIKGLLQTSLVHSRKQVSLPLIKYFVFCFSGITLPANLLIFPLLVFLIKNPIHKQIVLSLAKSGFLFSFGITIIMNFALMNKLRLKSIIRILFPGIIMYWVLYLWSGLRAFYQLLTKPHHWEKTDNSING
ncbi:MAG: glycosyltransferase [Nitrospirota bacterium]